MMKFSLLLLLPVLWLSPNPAVPVFDYHDTPADRPQKTVYQQLVNTGIAQVSRFFSATYPRRFGVFLQPDRPAFDKAYQQNYHQPNFHSGCWLVATGDGYRISILSPARWINEPCKDRYTEYSDRVKTQKLITHELVHVYHGQCNPNPLLNNGPAMDWFMEGLAYYTAGQLDATAQKEVQNAVLSGKVPTSLVSLSDYPDVGLRYNFSGSLVAYIDRNYGRTRLKSLLTLTNQKTLLRSLGLSERALLDQWTKAELKR